MKVRQLLFGLLAASLFAAGNSAAETRFLFSSQSKNHKFSVVSVDGGLVVDSRLSPSLGSGLTLRYIARETDITIQAVNVPPPVEVFTYFNGPPPGDICRHAVFLGELFAPTGIEHRVYADGEPKCTDVAPAGEGARRLAADLADLTEGYVRRLLFVVGPAAPGNVPEIVWQQRRITAKEFRAKATLLRELTTLLENAREGQVSFLSSAVYRVFGGPVVAVIGTAAGEAGRVTLLAAGDVGPPYELWLFLGLPVVAIAVLVLLVIVLVRRRRRKRTITSSPVKRVIRIGYGPDLDISLGDEGEREVLSIRVHQDGLATATAVSRVDKISLNGKRFSGTGRISPADSLFVNDRRILLRI